MSDKMEGLSVDKLKDILYDEAISFMEDGYTSNVLSKLQPFLKNRRSNRGRRRYEAPGQKIPIIKKRRRLIPVVNMYPFFDRRRNNYGVDLDE